MPVKGVSLGFSGTRLGMTQEQKIAFGRLVRRFQPSEFHHGCCDGSDEEAHKIVRQARGSTADTYCIEIIGHPPTNNTYRSWVACDQMRDPKPYLRRNLDIVRSCGVLIATPKRGTRSGGTWYTIHKGQLMDRWVLVIEPDGRIETN